MRYSSLFLAMLPLVGAMFAHPASTETLQPAMAARPALTPDEIDTVRLAEADEIITDGATTAAPQDSSPEHSAPSAAIARLQILLDRAGASPGVIDGLDGANLRKAILGFQLIKRLTPNGKLDARFVAMLDSGDQIIRSYVITHDDLTSVVGRLPDDYGELAKLGYLGYQSVEEALAERFHMDADFLRQLNPGSDFAEAQTIFVPDLGADRKGQAKRVEVDKRGGQVRAYAADGSVIATYPATIGSKLNPSPSGTHIVKVVVEDPTYTYNPKLNFQQADNDEVLTLPAGPNNPVGLVWIDLSEPTYGIHGTPEPDRIDKIGSHGCVRLTNWDAQELARMLGKGVPVTFKE